MKTLLMCLGLALTPVAATGLAVSLSPPKQEQAIKLPRDVYVVGTIDDILASSIKYQIEMLNKDGTEDITMHITSLGGSVLSGLQIYDTMMESQSKVNTVCEGYYMSMAAILLSTGAYREASQNTTIMFHEVSFGADGKLTQVKTQVKEAERLQAAIDTIIHEHSGLTFEQIKKMESYDHFMSSREAKELGLIDVVKEHKKK